MTALRYQNLLGVPSRHYAPVFGQLARRSIESFAPEVVALEVVPAMEAALASAAACWPTPVLAGGGRMWAPLVPGDSMVEAYRLAIARGVTVRCVDLPVRRPKRDGRVVPLGAELAAHVELPSLVQAVDALFAAEGEPLVEDIAREAAMARALRGLMATHARVLWVGGMAHWTRLVRRLEADDFDAPAVELEPEAEQAAYRMTGAALYELTGRTPYDVARCASDLEGYASSDALRALAVESCPTLDDDDAREFEDDDEETQSTADLTRLWAYARNLSAVSGVCAEPSFETLLRSAVACVGERYAARVFLRAFEEPASTEAAAEMPVMDRVWTQARGEFRADGEKHEVEPWWGVERSPGRMRWTMEEARRVATGRQRFFVETEDDEDEEEFDESKRRWTVLTKDEVRYRAYVDSVLRIASRRLTYESLSTKFVSGLGDGIDIRETIRRWQDDEVYVRAAHDEGFAVTNVVIDYIGDREGTDMHLSRGVHAKDGWIDPSWRIAGSVSRTGDQTVLQRRPIFVQRNPRYLSFVTTDLMTITDFEPQFDLYTEVILKLLDLPKRDNTLYGWMDVWCRFCQGKPLGYFSRYRPSRRLYAIAHRHGVKLIHVPLSQISPKMQKAHSHLYFMCMTRPQWERFFSLRPDQQEAFVRGEG
ncbi:MAG: hypothetical protein R3A52_15005 [Polyangiales bacterium]